MYALLSNGVVVPCSRVSLDSSLALSTRAIPRIECQLGERMQSREDSATNLVAHTSSPRRSAVVSSWDSSSASREARCRCRSGLSFAGG